MVDTSSLSGVMAASGYGSLNALNNNTTSIPSSNYHYSFGSLENPGNSNPSFKDYYGTGIDESGSLPGGDDQLVQTPTTAESLLAQDTPLDRLRVAPQHSAFQGTSNTNDLGVGISGPAVIELQGKLNDEGFDAGTPDGIFGPQTLRAVQQYQQSRIDSLTNTLSLGPPPLARGELYRQINELRNELDSGVAGSETQSQLGVDIGNAIDIPPTAPQAPTDTPTTNGPVTGLSEADYQSAADRLGVDVATVKAIAEVESSRSGFLESGEPSILFEAHIFSRATGGAYNGTHPNISSSSWDRSLYGSSGQHQHDRLASAVALDETAALESASWGAFQIMGFNHEGAGFDNVQDFVVAMRESESNQLDAFVSFVQSHPNMVTALRNQDWASFASAYNGPGYRENSYDTKIADAYERHSN